MLMSSEAIPNIYVQTLICTSLTSACSSTLSPLFQGYFIFKVPISPFSISPTWAISSSNTLATVLPHGLVFGETEQIIYSFGSLNSNSIQRIYAINGTV